MESERAARRHFGADSTRTPACQLKPFEEHLVDYIRDLEERLNSYIAEDSLTMRALYTMQADHSRALVKAEQEGYDKGVRDARKEEVA
jgi:hypothetical protein